MWREWWNRFVASDPALQRLRTAIRVATSVAITLAVAIPLLAVWKQPLPAAMIGAVVAINSSVAVNDETERQRRLTTLLMPLPAMFSLAVATATAAWPLLEIALFLVVIFAATYIRRFGPRFFALGMVGFMGYFFAMFLRPTMPQIPAMAFAALCGTLAAFALRFLLLSDAPEGVLDRGRRTLLAQVHGLVEAVRDVAEYPDSVARRRRLHDHSTRLNETALMLENTVQRLDNLGEAGREVLRQRILDVELAAENLLGPLLRIVDHPSGHPHVPEGLNAFLAVLRADPSEIREASRSVAGRVENDGSAEIAMSIRRLGTVLSDLATATGEIGRPTPGPDEAGDTRDAGSDNEQGRGADSTDEPATEDTGLKRPEVRTAVQVTCATAAAIICGHLISPNRWYWAVITAFVVFISTNSRGELLVRAWQRTAGTMLGVVAGILVAAQFSGNTAMELVLILCCVFLAFYFLGYSYALMTFFITTMLGVIYGILGTFDPTVLETRLVETAVGAAAGVLASALVLPTRTRPLVRTNMQDFLTSLREVLRGTGTELAEHTTVSGLREGVRDLDDRVHQLLRSARPLTGYRLRFQRSQLDRSLTVVNGCAYYVRSLTVVLPITVEMADDDTRRRLSEMFWAIAVAADALAEQDTGADPPIDFHDAIQPAHEHSDALHDIAESLSSEPTSLHRTIQLLDRVAQTLDDLAHELGATDRQPRAAS